MKENGSNFDQSNLEQLNTSLSAILVLFLLLIIVKFYVGKPTILVTFIETQTV